MARPLTPQQVKNLSRVQGSVPDVRNLRDAVKFHWRELAVGAMPLELNFFDQAATPGITNLEKINQLTYPLWITGLGVQIFGTAADVRLAHGHTEINLEKDERFYATFPTSQLPGGSGLRMEIDDATAATTHDLATHGLGNSFYSLKTPIKYDPDQTLRVVFRSDATVLAAATGFMVMLRGVEARTVI